MGKVFCSSDWHGCGTIAKKVMEYLQPDDKLYFLGDAIDRGEDGIEILQMLMRDPRVVFIRGNHEEMMRKRYRHDEKFDERHTWDYNGNYYTEKAFHFLSAEEQEEILQFLDKTPIKWVYKSKKHTFYMTHSGYMPEFSPYYEHPDTFCLLWDRKHFFDDWKEEWDKIIILHGHTPVQYLKFEHGYKGQTEDDSKEALEIKRQYMENGIISWKPEVLCYCDGHKYDLDMGTIKSKRIALLDLDTLEPIYFDEKEGE